MREPNWIVMSITQKVDVLVTRTKAARFADQMGFSDGACGEIATVVSELATDVVEFSGYGALTLSEYEEDGRVGIEIMVEDNGPGIRGPEITVDGESEGGPSVPEEIAPTRRSLDTVRRLVDDVQVENLPEGGIRFVARKWLDESSRDSSPHDS